MCPAKPKLTNVSVRTYRIHLLSISPLNPFKPNGISHYYLLGQFVFLFTVVWWYFLYLFKFKKNIMLAISEDPNKTPRSAASDPDLYCLPKSHKKVARLISVHEGDRS